MHWNPIFILSLFACTSTKQTDTDITPAHGLVMATVAMDYSVGALATFDAETETLTENIASISGDPALVLDGGWLWQINRYQYDTLRKYHPQNLQVPWFEVSLAPEVGSSNPHDVAMCADKLFVSLYGSESMPILDTDRLNEITRLNLSGWADDDGIPEASSLVVVGDKLYVGLQRLDRNAGFSPNTSKVLQIDCTDESVDLSWEIGVNIELIEWNDTVALITQASEEESAGVFTLDGIQWTRVWTSDSAMSSASFKDGRLFYSSLNDSQTEYVLHCVEVTSQTERISEGWSEYITDALIEDNSTGWMSAHWGWSDIANSHPGLYRMDLESCTVSGYWPMSLAPFSMVQNVENVEE